MTISTFILDSVAHSDFLSQVVTKSDVAFKSTHTHENAAHIFATETQERWSNVVLYSHVCSQFVKYSENLPGHVTASQKMNGLLGGERRNEIRRIKLITSCD